MRVFSRIALVVLAAVLSAPAAFASHLEADCPLTLVAQNPPSAAGAFYQSPHGVFRSGSQVFELRGQALTTYTVTDLGDLQPAREDVVGSMAARESNGGVAFQNGFLFVSSEAGLEIFDLRNVRVGGSPPLLVSRTPNLHYRRMAVNGNTLAALFPGTDMPCYSGLTGFCPTVIDLYDIANLASPTRVGSIAADLVTGGFNDITFNYGRLIAAATNLTVAYDISNRSLPTIYSTVSTPGTFLVSNGTNLLAVGNDNVISTYTVSPPGSGFFFLTLITMHTSAAIDNDRSNPLIFHPQATFDEAGSRIITMIDELNPQTLQPARTIAFDVFDYAVPMYEGSVPRIYEQISYTRADEVKYNPLAVGPVVYVVGQITGLQTYGACGQMTGKFEFLGIAGLGCGNAELHGWVTGALKITNVEIFLDGTTLGPASISGPPRTDVPSTTPVTPWRIGVNLDQTARGDHVLRAVGTDASGNRRQFASERVFFPGPGFNCVVRRRAAGLH